MEIGVAQIGLEDRSDHIAHTGHQVTKSQSIKLINHVRHTIFVTMSAGKIIRAIKVREGNAF
jgi:hypothetical protein